MCLDRLTHNRYQPKHGWKVFEQSTKTNELYGMFYGGFGPYPVNEWIKDKKSIKIKIGNYKKEYYESGFHCFRYKKDAINYIADDKSLTVKKVKVKDVTTYGTEYIYGSDLDIFVCNEMFIEEKKYENL